MLFVRGMRLHCRVFVACVVFYLGGLLTSGVNAQEIKPESALVIGVAPHTSARSLFSTYQSLRLYLQDSLQRDVRVVTAPSFVEFLNRALEGRYDIVFTEGHQARLLEQDAGFLPLVTYQAEYRVLWIKAANNASIHRLEDLNGKKVLSLGQGSLTALWSTQKLRERGVVPAKIGYVNASDSVVELILAGRAQAAALSQSSFERLTPNVRQKLHVLEVSPPCLGRVFMLNPRLADEYASIRQMFFAFAHSEAAQAYFQSNQLGGYREVEPAELELMETYTQLLRDSIKAEEKTKTQESDV
ncbi:MAG: phosphate/phosphite/phosphonate ABC transporter substrate-binding protein [Halothiobacillaceae bacterium]